MLRVVAAFLLASIMVISCGGPSDEGQNVVAAATPEAVEAGQEIFELGGNAMDAAVATALALGVTEPAGSGLGGQTVMLVHLPSGVFAINGSSIAPKATKQFVSSYDALEGRRATTVPASLQTLYFAWDKYGSGKVSWREVVAPAIRFARDGYKLGRFGRSTIEESLAGLRADPNAAKVFLTPEGNVPAIGTVIKQPLLAATLERIAKDGATTFYRGDIAEEIDRDLRAHDGWLSAEDLQTAPLPRVENAITTRYRDVVVHTVPPPYGGWVVLLTLNLLEKLAYNPPEMPKEDYYVALARAIRIAQRSRQKRPVENIDNYYTEVATKINKQHAEMLMRSEFSVQRGETTHFSVRDAQNMVVSVSQSINGYFGAKVMHPALGFFYNDYMKEFVLNDSRHPYALKAGAKPYSSMSPTIVTDSRGPVLALGSPGSERIISAVVQVISNWKDRAMPLDEAVAYPRIHVNHDSTLYAEYVGPLAGFQGKFGAMGFVSREAPKMAGKKGLSPFFGGVNAVAKNGEFWIAANDPRRDGPKAEPPQAE